MSPLIVACLLARTATITITLPATPAKKVVEIFAEKTGQKLNVSDRLASLFVVVRLREEPVEEALVRLAKALEGEWWPVAKSGAYSSCRQSLKTATARLGSMRFEST